MDELGAVVDDEVACAGRRRLRRTLGEMLTREIDDAAIDLDTRRSSSGPCFNTSRSTPPSPPPTMSTRFAFPWANRGTCAIIS